MRDRSKDTCEESASGAYLASDRFRSGRCLRLPNRPFNINYRIPQGNGFILINGDQITRIIVKQISINEWEVTFHISDGTKEVVAPSDWTRDFVARNRTD